ncbi:DUF924 family protein [Litoreibacter sp.]|nr:DUF924 family protein [Litoreibacter sp.]
MGAIAFTPDDVLGFWFPDSHHEASMETHSVFWDERMQGGMDAAIVDRFADVTHAGATGQLDHWADTPRGRPLRALRTAILID